MNIQTIVCWVLPSSRNLQEQCNIVKKTFAPVCGNELELATGFRSEKIPRNRLGMVSVITRKKVLIPSFTGKSIPKLGTERDT
jgi:hypothetical protein